MKKTLFVCALVPCLALGGCGKNSDEEEAAGDLGGWWLSTDNPSAERVMAFASQDEARWAFGVDIPATDAALLSYSVTGTNLLTSAEIKRGELIQVVLDGYGEVADGTEFRADVVEFEPQDTLIIDTESEGELHYTHYARCPLVDGVGSQRYSPACSTYFAAGPSLAIDNDGHVHALSGYVNLEPATLNCIPEAAYSLLSDGCSPVKDGMPAFDNSDIEVEGDDVHLVFTPTTEVVSGETPGSIRYRHAKKRSFQWEEEIVDPQPATVKALQLTLVGAEPAIAWCYSNQKCKLARRSAGSWSVVDLVDDSGALWSGFVRDMKVMGDGRLALQMSGITDGVLMETNSGAFEALLLPEGSRLVSRGINIDGQGQLHVQLTGQSLGSSPLGLYYSIFDGTAWSHVPIPDIGTILPAAAPPWRLARYFDTDDYPRLAVTEIQGDGSFETHLLHAGNDGGFNSALGEAWGEWTAAAGPDGTVAATWGGSDIYVYHRGHRDPGATTELTLTFNIPEVGRVFTDDGAVDCTDTCTSTVKTGRVLHLRSEPAQGYAGGVYGQYPTPDGAVETPIYGASLQIQAFFAPE